MFYKISSFNDPVEGNVFFMCGDSTENMLTRGSGNGSVALQLDTGRMFVKRAGGWVEILNTGADPWTYVRLASDFNTSSATAVDVTGLGFAPAANRNYEFYGQVFLRTTSATINPRAGLAWATGLTDGMTQINQTTGATGNLLYASGNPNAALLVPVGGLPNTTQSWPATYFGTAIAGATPSGSIRVQLASETAGTTVTMKAGSWIRYRTF